ncbi:MAG: hypothetical protein WBO93_07935, partial [Gammaproteobacteria bacterium]
FIWCETRADSWNLLEDYAIPGPMTLACCMYRLLRCRAGSSRRAFRREFLTLLRDIRGGNCSFAEISVLRTVFVHPVGLQIHERLFAD